MTSITEKAGNLLLKVGITVGKGNKLEFDKDVLKEKTALGKSGIEFDNISTLKSLFTGYGSFGSQILQKASAISSAAARSTVGTEKAYFSVLLCLLVHHVINNCFAPDRFSRVYDKKTEAYRSALKISAVQSSY